MGGPIVCGIVVVVVVVVVVVTGVAQVQLFTTKPHRVEEVNP